MASNQLPYPNSNSPSKPSAFQWPIPDSPSERHLNNNGEISLKEILEKFYSKDVDLLKHALVAKIEEDKKQTAHDNLKAEQARIRLRQLDLELVREQSKLATPMTVCPPYLDQVMAPSHRYGATPPYYSLAPVHQQVLARITESHQAVDHHQSSKDYGHHPPASPAGYPHSAHPLCPPDNNYTRSTPSRQFPYPQSNSTSQLQQHQPNTPISPGGTSSSNEHYDLLRKRGRASISYIATNESEDKISHSKVMEALKAKIQRGNSSPLAATALNSAFRPTAIIETATITTKRQRTLPKPATILTTANNSNKHENSNTTIAPIMVNTPTTGSPSPRSAKPILPPIDTTMGR